MNADPDGEDSRWLIVEDGFSAALASTYETLFTTATEKWEERELPGLAGIQKSAGSERQPGPTGHTRCLRQKAGRSASRIDEITGAWRRRPAGSGLSAPADAGRHSAGLGATVCNSSQRICRMVSPLPQPVSAVYTMALRRRPSARHSRSASDRLLPDVQVTAACSASSTLTGSR